MAYQQNFQHPCSRPIRICCARPTPESGPAADWLPGWPGERAHAGAHSVTVAEVYWARLPKGNSKITVPPTPMGGVATGIGAVALSGELRSGGATDGSLRVIRNQGQALAS